MKKTILTIAIAITATIAMAQQTSGTIEYEIVMDIEKMMKFFMPERASDVNALPSQWKMRKSKAELKFSETATLYSPIEEETSEPQWGPGSQNNNIFYCNNEKNKMCNVIEIMGKKYIIEDSIPKLKWKVTNAMKEVAGHICMSAVYNDTIMGREVTAWFALDMPLPYGPESFYGLPGMVLSIELYNGGQTYTAKKITMSNSQLKVDKPKYKKKSTVYSYADYQQTVYNFVQQSKKRKGGMPMIF